jgi:hypothetical protein
MKRYRQRDGTCPRLFVSSSSNKQPVKIERSCLMKLYEQCITMLHTLICCLVLPLSNNTTPNKYRRRVLLHLTHSQAQPALNDQHPLCTTPNRPHRPRPRTETRPTQSLIQGCCSVLRVKNGTLSIYNNGYRCKHTSNQPDNPPSSASLLDRTRPSKRSPTKNRRQILAFPALVS